jgi:uncharacterized protein YkvS
MTNTQLYFAIGLPCFTILTALVVNLVQIAGIRGDISEIRSGLKHIVQSLNELDKRVSIIDERLER